MAIFGISMVRLNGGNIAHFSVAGISTVEVKLD
jgi:hypothetical protein